MEQTRRGTISVNTENIFPIIKKSLYSNHEIFLRELVSNAVDATQKIKTLAGLGEFKGELGDLQVTISLDETAKTLTISDMGIGMTADEIEKYINQVAFSGATEFVKKYEGKTEQLIGNFGLGFYSAFMVSSKVEINTLSFKEGAEPAHWTCDGSTTFEINPGTRTERGTDIILHLADDGEEFNSKFKIEEILKKYCKFLPVDIKFDDKVINNTQPLWTKKPSELTDEDYLKFYEELYPFSEKPLFWIHLNVDYPFNLTGVLYFPKLKQDFEIQKSKIQLFSRQVFITDSVEEIVPDFLRLLHGVIDSPDIPLNVSRSFLQTDGNVKKINSHIIKKVADKLNDLFKNDRPSFEEKWQDLEVFVKYGMLTEEKFKEKANNFLLLKNLVGKHFTFEEYKQEIATLQTDKDGNMVVLYTHNQELHDTFIASAVARSYDVVLMQSVLDPHMVGLLEGNGENIRFKRVDSESIEKLIAKDEPRESLLNDEEKTQVEQLYKDLTGDGKYTISSEPLAADDLPIVITRSEFMRRMKEMSATSGGGFGGSFPDSYELVINSNHPFIKKMASSTDETRKNELARQALDLALISQGMLTGADLTKFVKRSLALAD